VEVDARIRALANRSQNFGFLLPLEPLLAATGEGAEAFVYADPNVALFKARLFGEVLVSELVRRLGLRVTGGGGKPPMQLERIKTLVHEGAVTTEIEAARVNLCEADFLVNHCVVAVSSFGSLIHATVGSAGGVGGLRTNRSGWAA